MSVNVVSRAGNVGQRGFGGGGGERGALMSVSVVLWRIDVSQCCFKV